MLVEQVATNYFIKLNKVSKNAIKTAFIDR